MVAYSVVPVEPKHMVELASTMAAEDRLETGVDGETPLEAISKSVMVSRDTKVLLADDKVVCMYGVGTVSLIGGIGVPWLLASNLVKTHARAFIRYSLKWRDEMRQDYRFLTNYVDARHTRAMRWLEWLGAVMDPTPFPMGPNKVPFYRFDLGEI